MCLHELTSNLFLFFLFFVNLGLVTSKKNKNLLAFLTNTKKFK